MIIMKIVVLVLFCLVLAGFIVYACYGGLKKLKIEIAEQGGETVVYEAITGDYRQSGVVMDKVYYALLNNLKIETYKGYGKYLDNPKKVEKSKLRSEAGCIIDNGDISNPVLVTCGFKIKILPVQRYIVTEFPYIGKMSVLFSITRVYPALARFAVKQGFDADGAVTEIYNVPEKKIFYRKEIIER